MSGPEISFRRVTELRIVRDVHNNWIEIEAYNEEGKKIHCSPISFFGAYRGEFGGRENRVMPIVTIVDESEDFKRTETHRITATPVLLLVE